MENLLLLFCVFLLFSSCGEKRSNELDLEEFPSMNFEESVKFFKKSDKLILIYFNGFGCVNCRKFDRTLADEVRLEEIKSKYNFINLHLDDREKLPEAEWFEYRKHTVKTRGGVNQMIQTEKLQTGSQPYLAIMNKEGEIIKYKSGFKYNVKEFLELED